jgi:hypothetical protein
MGVACSFGQNNERSGPLAKDGVTVKGIPLGVELFIYKFRRPAPPLSYAYVAKVAKSDMILPDDADWVYDDKKAVDLTLKYDPALLEDKMLAGFYPSETSHLPLAFVRIEKAKGDSTDARVMPGTYWVRVGSKQGNICFLRKIDILPTTKTIWVADKPAE